MAQSVAHQFRGDVHNMNHPVISHACRTNHTERANHLAVNFIRSAHDGEFFNRHDLAFAANVDTHALGLGRNI